MIKTDSTEDPGLSGYGGVSGAVVSFSMGDGKCVSEERGGGR